MPNITICNTFEKALTRLDGRDQALAKQTVYDFMTNPEASGHRLHALDCRERRFASVSINKNLRIILLRDRDTVVFMHVDHHDAAYRWAERRKVETNRRTGSAQVVEFAEVVREEVREVIREVPREVPRLPLFAGEDDDYLLGLGVPEELLPIVKEIDEDGLVALLGKLPDEASEALMAIHGGERPKPQTRGQGDLLDDPYAHPDARRRFWIATDEVALKRALERPWAEWLVFLHPHQRDAVDRNFNGPARVSGSAGTGKTVVAMHRAAALSRLSSGGQILLTTFSKTLAGRLASGMDTLMEGEEAARGRIRVVHLHAYARSVLAAREVMPGVIDQADLDELLARAAAKAGLGEDRAFIRSEWDAVIDFWGIRAWPAYRDVVRSGRGAALPPARREALWAVFEAVQAEMTQRDLATWGDVCDAVRGMLDAQGLRPFRHVIVDEAQDLGPRELRLVAALAPSGPRALFFAGDIGQRIYRWPFSWLRAGVDVRGRARRLTVNYRTSDQIKRFSDALSPGAMPDDDEEDRGAISLLQGPAPEVVGGSGVEAEVEALAGWLRGLLEKGVKPDEIAVFSRTRRLLRERAEPAAMAAGIPSAVISGEADAGEGAVALGTIHAAKGLEFRAVALVGCDARYMPLAAALRGATSDEDRAMVEARERQLLYVGCTRARDFLLLTYADTRSPYLPAGG